MDKIILHADMNSFFASVEMLFRPELRLVPMAVAGDAEKRRGIILAKNELAKACGVQTAETIWQARRKCPHLQLVHPDHSRYQQYSEQAFAIFCRLTDKVESFGLDEAWMDVTGSTALFGDGPAMADWLRRQTKEELGLTCSVGVSFTKVFAKLGSDMRKPDATTVITRDNYRQLVWPLPVGELLYVGEATGKRLNQVGIKTIGDLARCDPDLLRQWLGRHGPDLWREANGEGDATVAAAAARHEVKSISNSTTTAQDLTTNEQVKAVIYQLADQVAVRLRAHRLRGRTVQVSIRDSQFRTIDRQAPLPRLTDLAADIAPLAMAIFAAQYPWQYPVRNLGVRVTDLAGEDALEQMTLQELPQGEPAMTTSAPAGQPGLPNKTDRQSGQPEVSPMRRRRQAQLESTLDTLRGRFGIQKISRGLTMGRPGDNESPDSDPHD